MMRLGMWGLGVVVALIVLWQECGENLGVFCYRMGFGLFARARSAQFVPILVTEKVPVECWNSSDIYSTRSTMWKH